MLRVMFKDRYTGNEADLIAQPLPADPHFPAAVALSLVLGDVTLNAELSLSDVDQLQEMLVKARMAALSGNAVPAA